MIRRTTELRRISADEFVSRLKQSVERVDQRFAQCFAFFLGAGCSISSGIPSASHLVRHHSSHSDWLRRWRDVRSPSTSDTKIDEWARKELSSWNPEQAASSYGELIEKLFLTAGDRQREIERLCDEGHNRDEMQKPVSPFPNFGYAVLSSLMCQQDRRFNVALTTNFDDLLTDAFFHFQDLRPLVIHHDSLAPFIRPTDSRPLVIKLHGDHRLAPRNTSAETEVLPEIVAQRVSTVLHDRGLVFLGYGGNDESILSMMERLPEEALPFGIYWVSGSEPRGIFRPWLESRGAVWVENGDFDELMLRFEKSFKIEAPNSYRHDRVLERYRKTRRSLELEIAERPPKSVEDAKFKISLAIGIRKLDPVRAEQLFEEAIKKFPDSADFLVDYANFLRTERKDLDRAEEFYKKAVEADPKFALARVGYANFLRTERKDLDRAEEFYKKAIEADPKHAVALGNFASFLRIERKDLDRAEEFYKKAVEADPQYTVALGSYANFLRADRKDLDRAEEFYKKAFDADPRFVPVLVAYANFLRTDRKDLDRAEEFYKRAVKVDPKSSLVAYANFLRTDRKDLDRAEEFYKRAVKVDPKSSLVSYANFLRADRKDFGRAEEFFKKAIEADCENAITLANYANFLADERKSSDRAEEFYKKAIEADPKYVVALGNYANFLANERKDPDRAEEFYKKAIEADCKSAGALTNYASFLADERKDPNRAEEFYKRAIEADPKSAVALGNYAILLANEQENPARAKEYFERAIESDLMHPVILGNYANLLWTALKDLDCAEEFFKKATEADPNSAFALANYANFLRTERKDLDGAEEFYKRAIDADPKHVVALGSYAVFLVDDRKDLERAEEFFKKSIEADPNHAVALGNYAGFQLGYGVHSEGLALLDAAMDACAEYGDSCLKVELAFYAFANGKEEKRAASLDTLKRLIDAGVRSPGWNLQPNITRAIADGRRSTAWLQKLAAVISDGADPIILKGWKVWQKASQNSAMQ